MKITMLKHSPAVKRNYLPISTIAHYKRIDASKIRKAFQFTCFSEIIHIDLLMLFYGLKRPKALRRHV